MSASEATLTAEIRSATESFAEVGIASPEADAVALAAYVMVCEPEEVRRRMILREAVDGSFSDRFGELVAERVERVPLQHLTGVAHFRRLTVRVGPGVFVPRPETELVAGAAIDAAKVCEAPLVVDLCTGSGVIALAVKDEVPQARVVAVELDRLAFEWAVANRSDTNHQIELIQADATTALTHLDGQVDVVVSNPPYIPTGMVPIDPEVRDHDPEVALYGGSADGLRIPERVAARAAGLLRRGGLLVMEHADTHGQMLPQRLAATGEWTEIVDHPDLNGRARFVTAQRR